MYVIIIIRKSLAVGVACMAIYWPTPGSKARTFKLCVPTRRTLTSPSAAPHCGRRGRGSFRVEEPKTEKAREPTVESLVRGTWGLGVSEAEKRVGMVCNVESRGDAAVYDTLAVDSVHILYATEFLQWQISANGSKTRLVNGCFFFLRARRSGFWATGFINKAYCFLLFIIVSALDIVMCLLQEHCGRWHKTIAAFL